MGPALTLILLALVSASNLQLSAGKASTASGDPCAVSPCKNGATCKRNGNQYACQCAPGFTGTDCDTDIDECESSPCLHGATCVDIVNGYTCTCTADYTGTHCETDVLVYNGTWFNEVGAAMNLSLSSTGFLQGQYFTSGDTTDGTGVPMVGLVNSPSVNSTFGVVALWDGTYVVSWNGEYKVCDGAHVLFTTFTLKPVTTLCRLSKVSTRVGQDCFTRQRQVPLAGESCPASNQPNPCNSPC